MTVPVSPARRGLFDPAFVRFNDGPALVSIDETDPGGAATIGFAVEGPSVTIRGKRGSSLYWLKSQRCADGAIVIWCAGDAHAHLVELKQTITADSWNHVTTQFDGMLANVHAMLGAALLAPPVSITCHIAFANDRLAVSPVLSKVINTGNGPKVLAGAQWAAGTVDLLDRTGIVVNKIVWGSAATRIACP